MKKIIAFLSAVSIISAMPFSAYAVETDYKESTETINNPACGYTTTVWAVCKPQNTPVYNPTGNLVLFFIDIGNFSGGANSDGKDYDLDDAFFSAWDETLQNCKDNGCMVALRFRYDANGKDNPEPETFEQVLNHVQQVKDSGLLEKYSDILAYVESGFVGKWGEQHGGKYTSVQYKAKLLQAVLDAVPSPIPVTVRTPDIFAEWAGIKRSQLADTELIESLTESEYCPDIQAYRNRIGLYDDGYMGSNSDLGTYADREIETTWLRNQTYTSYFGGEFSGNIEFAKQYDTYLPENAIPEMYRTHLSYINSNIFQLYNDYEYSADYGITADTSAYYGKSVYKFIRDHIGYRFVLRNSEITAEAVQGGDITVDFDVENIGFANVIPDTKSYVILEKDGIYMTTECDVDCKKWDSCTVSHETLNIKIPDNIESGEWNIYFKINVGTDADILNMNSRSIRFANNNTWNGSIGANLIGKTVITESAEKSSDNAHFYSVGNGITVDGIISQYEWDKPCAESEIYTYADENYLYVMTPMSNKNTSAPVYNIQLTNAQDNERYWLYYMSNGFVYFNKGDYNGCQCKWSEDFVEFRLPLDKINMKSGDKITRLRIFLQDSGNEWAVTGDDNAYDIEVESDLSVFSAYSDVYLNEGESYEYTVITESDNMKYEWLKDGITIPETDKSITVKDAGAYDVKITSETGIEKTVHAFRVHTSETKNLKGDANCDGYVNIADATAIIQHMGNRDKYGLSKQGLINADVDGAEGVTGLDALKIQELEAGIIESL
ncbi:MAG: DUF4832 domain-containing protein [Ruminococcus sp.]|nr:DUF4832 domain-containing protein [Ruminococcus sp.]